MERSWNKCDGTSINRNKWLPSDNKRTLKKNKMSKEMKDTAEILIMNGTAVGFQITQCNEVLTFISLVLAISLSCFKLFKWLKKK